MSRPEVTIELNGQLYGYLEALLATGLYGFTIEDVAERLLCQGIEQKLSEGLLDRQRPRPKRKR